MEVKITITSSPEGAVKVDGPAQIVGNPVIMYGLLERAKDAIRDLADGDKTPIALARGGMPNGSFPAR